MKYDENNCDYYNQGCKLYSEVSNNEKGLNHYTHQESPNENYFEELNDYLDGTMAR